MRESEPPKRDDFVWVWQRFGATAQLPAPPDKPRVVPGFWQSLIDALFVVSALLAHGRAHL